MAYDGERIIKAIQTLINANVSDELDAVEVLWSEDQIALDDPVDVALGYKPTILELPSTGYPIVSIFGYQRNPRDAQAGRIGTEDVTHDVRIEFAVVADDETTAAKISHRYAEALIRVLQSQRIFDGYAQDHHEPTVTLAAITRHSSGGTTGDMFSTTDVDYIRLGEIALSLTGTN